MSDSDHNHPSVITPNWPVPPQVRAFTTTRKGGYSLGPWASFNLATHTHDDVTTVLRNRELLQHTLQVPPAIAWLNQTHSSTVVNANDVLNGPPPNADASFTVENNVVCAVLTADCLPVLLYDAKNNRVAAVHAGWRGLANQIILQTLTTMRASIADCYAWLGPCISQNAYEVGAELYQQFISLDPTYGTAFQPQHAKYQFSLTQVANLQLLAAGLAPTQITHANRCTFSEDLLFYSYRRDGEQTGRLASLIWLSDNHSF